LNKILSIKQYWEFWKFVLVTGWW